MKGRKRLCVVACVLSMSVGEVSMGMGIWHGQAMYACSCSRTCRLWLGRSWAGLGPVGWVGGPLGRRCGPVKVGDYLGTEHTREQAWRASKQEAGWGLNRIASQATDDLPHAAQDAAC